MRTLTKNRPNNLIKRLLIIIAFLAIFLIWEPVKPIQLFSAVPHEFPGITSSHLGANYPTGKIAVPVTQQKSRAPEPNTLFLILSGMGGLIVRFAQKSFKKFKRALDLFLAASALFITSPILLFSAFLIKLTSKGPAIYKQYRVGKNSKIFEIYKLRTMMMDAEKETGAIWAKENDPRITTVGKLLRKTHIDEIPQLLNVLRGEMSIVGPRPERPEMVRDFKKLIRDYEKRLDLKPGITGIAQVRYKYDDCIEDVKKKLKYDLLYSRNMRVSTDMAILAQTVAVVLTGRGAR